MERLTCNENQPLNPDELLFIDNWFLAKGNLTKAFKLSFPELCKLKTEGAISSSASRMGNRKKVKEEIERQIHEKYEQNHFNAERVLNEIASIAFGYDNEVVRDRLKALEMIQKQLQLITNKVEVKQEVIEVNLVDDEEANED